MFGEDQMKNMKLIFSVLIFNFFISIQGLSVPQEPFQSNSLPYGRQLRVILSGKIQDVSSDNSEEIPDKLSWWQSLSRNNTIDCECGKFSQTSSADRWHDEGIHSLNVYPWSVSLVAPGGNFAFCGGTLVNDRYVLTSASCVDGALSDGVEVLVGSWPAAHFPNNSDPDELNTSLLFRKKVHRVILHPMYFDSALDYNIALLRLQGPVPTFGSKDGLTHVCLPSTKEIFDGDNASSLLWRFHDSYGYIYPIKRTEMNSTILSAKECKSYEHNVEWKNMPDTILCSKMDMPTIDNHPYKESWDCPGDAGGFLLVNRGHQKVQVGIDSWTACFGRPKGVGIYTRLTEFMPWISLHISKDGRHCAS